MPELTLSHMAATLIFVVACWCGHRYRYVWKAEGPTWQLWVYGVAAAVGLLMLGFIPIV